MVFFFSVSFERSLFNTWAHDQWVRIERGHGRGGGAEDAGEGGTGGKEEIDLFFFGLLITN